MSRPNGKVTFTIGGARGQGACHTKRFFKEGVKVVFTDILTDEGEALAKEHGENAKFMIHDVFDK